MKNFPTIKTQVEYEPISNLSGLLPPLIERAGKETCRRYLEYFAAQIRNRGTRAVYARAAARFFAWCDEYQIELVHISPLVVASYIEQLMQKLSPPTVKLHLAAIRSLFDYLVIGQVLPVNPAAAVRGPKHVVKKGKTPLLSAEEARLLLDGIDLQTIAGVRDRALIGLLVYSFARVSAAVGMNVGDDFSQGRRMWFRLHEKGGKHHEVPAHHNAEEYLDAYMQRAGIRDESQGPLFRTIDSWSNLTTRRMHRVDVLRLIKRRARQVGITSGVCCHTFRATGITIYLQGGGQSITTGRAGSMRKAPKRGPMVRG